VSTKETFSFVCPHAHIPDQFKEQFEYKKYMKVKSSTSNGVVRSLVVARQPFQL